MVTAYGSDVEAMKSSVRAMSVRDLKAALLAEGMPPQTLATFVEKKEFQRITIDFSTPPQYGPPDFKGVWDPKQKGIRFYDDENFLAERQVTSNA